jgi:hypothetical protein
MTSCASLVRCAHARPPGTPVWHVVRLCSLDGQVGCRSPAPLYFRDGVLILCEPRGAVRVSVLRPSLHDRCGAARHASRTVMVALLRERHLVTPGSGAVHTVVSCSTAPTSLLRASPRLRPCCTEHKERTQTLHGMSSKSLRACGEENDEATVMRQGLRRGDGRRRTG